MTQKEQAIHNCTERTISDMQAWKAANEAGRARDEETLNSCIPNYMPTFGRIMNSEQTFGEYEPWIRLFACIMGEKATEIFLENAKCYWR